MTLKIEKSNINLSDRIIRVANTIPDYINKSEKIKNAASKMILSGSRILPVVDDSRNLVGIITTMDILSSLLRNVDFNKKISDIMVRHVVACGQDEQTESVLQKMIFSKRGGIPIINNGKLVGIVTERNFVRILYNANFNGTVESVMTKKPFVVKYSTTIDDTLRIMANTHYRRLPVISGKKLVGIVTSMDLLKHYNNKNFTVKKNDEQVETISSKNIFSITKESNISNAVKLMTEKDVGALPVVDSKEELLGIITERNIVEQII